MKNFLFSDKMALIGLILLQNFKFFAQNGGLVDSVKFAGGATSVVYKKDSEADDMAVLLALNGSFSTNEEVKISVSKAKPTAQNAPDPEPQKVVIESPKPVEKIAQQVVEKPAENIAEEKVGLQKTASTAKMASGKVQKSAIEKGQTAQKSTTKTAFKKSSGKKSFAKPMSKKRFRWPSVSLPSIGRDTSGRTGCYRF